MRSYRTILWLAIIVVSMGLLVSCGTEQGTPENEPPPPPSPEETREASSRLWQSISQRKIEPREDVDRWIQRARGEISQFKQRHGVTSTGQQETGNLARRASNMMQQQRRCFRQ